MMNENMDGAYSEILKENFENRPEKLGQTR